MKVNENIILCQNLTKKYGQEHVLNGIDFTLNRGSFLALMGDSGSGKTTLLNIVAGLDRGEGVVSVFGNNLSDMDDDALLRYRRNHTAFIFQSFHLLPTLTAEENITLPLKLTGKQVRPEEILNLFEKVGLSHRMKRFSDTLSGGEMQRVAIARALALRPDILFADEPTGSLDKKNGDQILDLICSLQKNLGLTIIMATHSHRAARMADQIFEMEDGKILSRATEVH